MEDPTISRIRKVRKAISESCDHNPEKLVSYYMKLEKGFKGLVYQGDVEVSAGKNARGKSGSVPYLFRSKQGNTLADH